MTAPDVIAIELSAGYRISDALRYHGRDPQSRSERVTGALIEKPVRLEGGWAVLALDLGEPGIARILADRPLDEIEAASARRIAERMLGLFGDPAALETLPAARELVAGRIGLRLPLTAAPFEALCWAIIGQQINLTFAAALRREMVALAGTPLERGLILHPDAAAVAALDPAALTDRRFSRSKARYLIGAAMAVAEGRLDLDALAGLPSAEAEAALTALSGIGPWTARYLLLRGLGHGDVAPIGDSGLATGLQRLLALPDRPTAPEQEAAMLAFAPHRSLATAHLWASLADQAASGTKSRKPVTRAIRPSETVAKSVPPASGAPSPGASSQLKRR